MIIKKITTLEELQNLKANWVDIYVKDHNATVFSSWEWTFGWLKSTEENWVILAVNANAENCVSFALLRKTNSALHAGTSPIADHISYICLPEHKIEANMAINDYISKHMRWLRYELRDIFDDHFDTSIKYWSSFKYKVNRLEDTPCPYIELPDSWESYLATMRKKTRLNINRSIKKTENLENFKLTLITEDTYNSDIHTVLSLWQEKWSSKDKTLIKAMKGIFRECFLNDKLRVIIFWVGSVPIAASLGLHDPEKKSFYTYIGGYDADYKETSPGIAIIADEIKYAISNGYKFFDLLRGAEEYKYMTFKAKDRFNKNYIIENRIQSKFNKIKKLVRQSIKRAR